jgi:hypothetical protein
MNEKETINKNLLKIKSIRTSSRAFQMKLKEDDIIIGLDGEFVYSTYEIFSKQLKDIVDKKIITILRDDNFFNTFIYGPLGIVCEEIDSKEITLLDNFNFQQMLDKNTSYQLFEVYVKPNSVSILLDTVPSILASLAPPLWMVQNRLWTLFLVSMIFYLVLIIISPWLFFYWMDFKIVVCWNQPNRNFKVFL